MAELVAVVFEVTVKVAVHTTPGDRLEMVTVNGEMDVVTDELETTVLSESFLTVTSTVTPAPGSFELMATFASVWRPKLYIHRFRSRLPKNDIFLSWSGGRCRRSVGPGLLQANNPAKMKHVTHKLHP